MTKKEKFLGALPDFISNIQNLQENGIIRMLLVTLVAKDNGDIGALSITIEGVLPAKKPKATTDISDLPVGIKNSLTTVGRLVGKAKVLRQGKISKTAKHTAEGISPKGILLGLRLSIAF